MSSVSGISSAASSSYPVVQLATKSGAPTAEPKPAPASSNTSTGTDSDGDNDGSTGIDLRG